MFRSETSDIVIYKILQKLYSKAMLTKGDLNQIQGVIKSEIKPLAKDIGTLKKDIVTLKKDAAQTRNDVKTLISYFDREYVELRKKDR